MLDKKSSVEDLPPFICSKTWLELYPHHSGGKCSWVTESLFGKHSLFQIVLAPPYLQKGFMKM